MISLPARASTSPAASFSLKFQPHGGVQSGGKFANCFFHVWRGCISILPGGIAHDDHVIVIIYLRPFGNVREKYEAEAWGTRLVEFQSGGVAAGNGGPGQDPGLRQRRS